MAPIRPIVRSASYVDAHVSEHVDAIGRYCKWGAQLVRLDDYR
jgi:hypothetical protein